MAKAKKSGPSKQAKSFVNRVQYLILTRKKMETMIGLIIGFFTGSIPPIGSYIVFHILIHQLTGGRLVAAVLAGVASLIISLLNVSRMMTELTKSQVQGWCYAILLESLAMFVTGPSWVSVFTLTALAVVIMANWVKMAHNSLLRT